MSSGRQGVVAMMATAMLSRGRLVVDDGTKPDGYGGRCNKIRRRLRTMRQERVMAKTASNKIGLRMSRRKQAADDGRWTTTAGDKRRGKGGGGGEVVVY
jgi:hypothetical protein